jgi:hypothetical protein
MKAMNPYKIAMMCGIIVYPSHARTSNERSCSRYLMMQPKELMVVKANLVMRINIVGKIKVIQNGSDNRKQNNARILVLLHS